MEAVIVWGIGCSAAGYIAYRAWQSAHGKRNCGCGCSCSDDNAGACKGGCQTKK